MSKKAIRIGVVMVIYNELIQECNTYRSLLAHLNVENYLLYDNSLEKKVANAIVSPNYIHDSLNPGVSKAYNKAAHWARQNEFTHLLLTDSDTSFPEDALKVYKDSALNNFDQIILPEVRSKKHIISPFWFKWGRSWYGDDIPFGKITFKKQAAINSGMLIPLHLFENAGGYDPTVPLDWSDIIFCKKLGEKGISGQKINLLLDQELSEDELVSINKAKFRFSTYLLGLLKVPTTNAIEKIFMLFWAKLRALKYCFKYKDSWFLFHYIRKLIHV